MGDMEDIKLRLKKSRLKRSATVKEGEIEEGATGTQLEPGTSALVVVVAFIATLLYITLLSKLPLHNYITQYLAL